MKFLEAVRNSTIKQPIQMNFSLKHWEAQYQRHNDSSTEDLNLFQAGIIIFQKLESIRKLLSKSKLTRYHQCFVLKSFVSVVNRDLKGVESKFSSTEKTYILEEGLLDTKRVGKYEIDATSDDVLEISIDSIVFPIKKYMKQNDKDSLLRIDNFNEFSEDLLRDYALAQIYFRYDELWKECLWNEWYVSLEKDNIIFSPRNADLEHIKTFGVYDRYHAKAEKNNSLVSFFMKDRSHPFLEMYFSSLSAKVTKKKGKINFLKVTRSQLYDFESLRSNAFYRLVAIDYYTNIIFDEEHVRVGKHSFKLILNVWDIIYDICYQLYEMMNYNRKIKSYAKLVQFSANVNKQQLTSVIAECMDIDETLSSEIIELFVFQGGMNQDIWIQPIISVGNNEYCFLLIPVLFGDEFRLIDKLLKMSDYNYDERGKKYEHYLRSELSENCKDSKLAESLHVYEKSYIFKNEVFKEEVDLLITLDNYVIIGEVKCSLFPTDSIEFYNYRKDIQGGIDQIERKFRKIQLNKQKLVDDIYEYLDVSLDANNIHIIPIVVTNLSFGIGFMSSTDILVVDFRSLNFYLSNGVIRLKQLNVSEGIDETLFERELYSTLSEAKTKFIENMRIPFNILYNIDKLVPYYERIPNVYSDEKSTYCYLQRLK